DVAVEEKRLGETQAVVLRARSRLDRDREALTAPEEVRGLERQLAEKALVLRHAGAERQLVAVLLLELQPHVHPRVLAVRLVDRHVLRRAFERLEVAELIEPPDAVLQRLAVEDAV